MVKNVFLRLWHNDLYNFRQEKYKALRQEADHFWKRLRALGKFCQPLASPPAAAYFKTIVDERKEALALKAKTETDLVDALWRAGFSCPYEALSRLYPWGELPQNPVTKKVIIARILSNNAAFSYDVPEELR